MQVSQCVLVREKIFFLFHKFLSMDVITFFKRFIAQMNGN